MFIRLHKTLECDGGIDRRTAGRDPSTSTSLCIASNADALYTLNHKKRDILFLTITLDNLRGFL